MRSQIYPFYADFAQVLIAMAPRFDGNCEWHSEHRLKWESSDNERVVVSLKSRKLEQSAHKLSAHFL